MKIIANEYIYPLDDMSCHASHFVLLDSDTDADPGNAKKIFAVWFYGTAEGNDDVCIYGAVRDEKGKWGEPRRLTAEDGTPHWNPVLYKRKDGSIMLIYKVGKPIADWHTEYMISTDNCETFGESRELVPGDISGGRGPVRNKIITLSDGSILAPGSTEKVEWKCFIDRSEDDGETWTRSADIRAPKSYLDTCEDLESRGLIQPTLWESGNGKVHALMRSTEGHIFRSDSEDFGRTWSESYAISMKNNNSGIDVVNTDKGLFLVCNPKGLPEGKIWGRRSPLSLFVSHDNGESFEKVTEIATGAGVFAYPAIRYEAESRGHGARLHITYTWNRKLIMYTCIEF